MNILACLYANSDDQFTHSSFRGVDECNDFGHMSINTGKFFSKNNSMEVHLHPADNENMAISPNNGAFLLNLGFPIINFHIVMCTLDGDQ